MGVDYVYAFHGWLDERTLLLYRAEEILFVVFIGLYVLFALKTIYDQTPTGGGKK